MVVWRLACSRRLGHPSRRLRSKRVAHLRHPSRWWRAKSAGLLQIQMVLRTCKRNVKKSGVWFTFQTMAVVIDHRWPSGAVAVEIDGPQEQRSLGARTVRSSGRRERWPLGAMAVRSRGRRSSGPRNSRRAPGTSEQRLTAVGARDAQIFPAAAAAGLAFHPGLVSSLPQQHGGAVSWLHKECSGRSAAGTAKGDYGRLWKAIKFPIISRREPRLSSA